MANEGTLPYLNEWKRLPFPLERRSLLVHLKPILLSLVHINHLCSVLMQKLDLPRPPPVNIQPILFRHLNQLGLGCENRFE
jgi:hypothetical protein